MSFGTLCSMLTLILALRTIGRSAFRSGSPRNTSCPTDKTFNQALEPSDASWITHMHYVFDVLVSFCLLTLALNLSCTLTLLQDSSAIDPSRTPLLGRLLHATDILILSCLLLAFFSIKDWPNLDSTP